MPDCGILNIEGLTNEALVPKVIPTGAADETPDDGGFVLGRPPSKAAPTGVADETLVWLAALPPPPPSKAAPVLCVLTCRSHSSPPF